MKAIEILKNLKNEMQNNDGIINWDCSYEYFKKVNNAIKELEDYKTNYQGAIQRLESTVTTLAVLKNENKSLVKTLMKMNEEMIKLREENQELTNVIDNNKR